MSIIDNSGSLFVFALMKCNCVAFGEQNKMKIYLTTIETTCAPINSLGRSKNKYQQLKQHKPTTIPLATYGGADRSNGCEIRTQRALERYFY